MNAMLPAEAFALRLLPVGTSPSTTAAATSDDQIVREFARTHSDDLFEQLVDRHKDRVFRLTISVLGPGWEDEAEDLTQEIFLTVYGKIEEFRGDSSFSTWLYRMTYNRAIDARRGVRHRYPHVGEEAIVGRRDPAADPQSRAASRQLRSWLLASIDRLGEPHRSVLLLYYWLERPVTEIAQLLELKTGTVKSHLHRARKRLAAFLHGIDDDG